MKKTSSRCGQNAMVAKVTVDKMIKTPPNDVQISVSPFFGHKTATQRCGGSLPMVEFLMVSFHYFDASF